jgi:hypothetical protein
MRRLFTVIALLLLPIMAATAPARADDAAAGNSAQNPSANPFVVKDVKVDASAASAAEAFTIAVDQGRQEAWEELMHRMTRQEDWAQIPAVDTAALKRMTSGYQVTGEKRSTTRYVANVTYTFNGKRVRRFLQSANIAYADISAPPLLVIPMNPEYVPASAWVAAWGSANMAGSAVPLELPTPDALNRTLLAPLDFDSAAWSDIQPVAQRAGAKRAALVLLGPGADGQMSLRIRILTPAGSQVLGPLPVPATSAALGYAAAVQASADAIGNLWKARSAVDFNQHSALTAEIQLDSLADWGKIQERLVNVPVVTNVNVEAMTIGHARIVIRYAGTLAQLSNFLSQASLGLTNRDGVWWLNAQTR